VDTSNSEIRQDFGDQDFVLADIVKEIPFPAFSASTQFGERDFSVLGGVMSGGDLACALLNSHPRPLNRLGFRLGSRFNTGVSELCAESSPV